MVQGRCYSTKDGSKNSVSARQSPLLLTQDVCQPLGLQAVGDRRGSLDRRLDKIQPARPFAQV